MGNNVCKGDHTGHLCVLASKEKFEEIKEKYKETLEELEKEPTVESKEEETHHEKIPVITSEEEECKEKV